MDIPKYRHICEWCIMELYFRPYVFYDGPGWNGYARVYYPKDENGAETSFMIRDKQEAVTYLENHKHPNCPWIFTLKELENEITWENFTR